jgi:hypothetical protein
VAHLLAPNTNTPNRTAIRFRRAIPSSVITRQDPRTYQGCLSVSKHAGRASSIALRSVGPRLLLRNGSPTLARVEQARPTLIAMPGLLTMDEL